MKTEERTFVALLSVMKSRKRNNQYHNFLTPVCTNLCLQLSERYLWCWWKDGKRKGWVGTF